MRFFPPNLEILDSNASDAAAGESAVPNCVEGDCFDPRATIGDKSIPLRGAAMFRVLNMR